MIHLIDSLHLGLPNAISIVLIPSPSGELILVDTGPESVFETVVAKVRELGFDPHSIRHILASHIHLDHTGAAWRWAKEFGTIVHVHPYGAPHLVAPAKLLASAARIYGNRMEYLWGQTGPIPEDQVRPATDCLLELGGLAVNAFQTPGHANHHNGYWIESEGAVFAGDVAGVKIGSGPSVPPFPPPEINLERWRESLQKIRALSPKSIYITHFGELTNPLSSLEALESRLSTWSDWIKLRMNEGKSEQEMLPGFQAFVAGELLTGGASPAELKTYEQADPASMSVTGLARYWRKYHPEALLDEALLESAGKPASSSTTSN
jgi:glyoxylase-like metal-dependent hydrolase (beta-lactamase superfamily II)